MDYDINILKDIKEKLPRIELMIIFHRELSAYVEKLKNSCFEYCLEQTQVIYKMNYEKLVALENMIVEEVSNE